ncbi:tryptophan--tRNA ligase [bacterium]|nr:tryptophan--tRNA ligase [bacterium]
MGKRILSGMRPTGKLHLGNYVGALENWIELQNQYNSFHMIADYHMLTTDLQHTDKIWCNSVDVVIDWLSAGLDPEKSPVFVQSHVKEHTELTLIFSMLVTVARLQRNPTLKEQAKDLDIGANMVYGFLGYPVLQAADILLYKADAVPVGEDQAPHVEITREIARKFNSLFGEVFPEPETLLTKFARLPGLDNKKMSKSLNNSIAISDSPEDIEKKIMRAYTDPARIKATDPGHPEGCVVFAYHKKFSPDDCAEVERQCKMGELGCVAHKRAVAKVLSDRFESFRSRREYYIEHKNEVFEIIEDGDRRAREVAEATMKEVRRAMKMG